MILHIQCWIQKPAAGYCRWRNKTWFGACRMFLPTCFGACPSYMFWCMSMHMYTWPLFHLSNHLMTNHLMRLFQELQDIYPKDGINRTCSCSFTNNKLETPEEVLHADSATQQCNRLLQPATATQHSPTSVSVVYSHVTDVHAPEA